MNQPSNSPDQKRKLDDILDDDPSSKRGDQGESVDGGRQAGPNSDRAGEPVEPQTGDPTANDRRPN